MRIHTNNATGVAILRALNRAKDDGHVTSDIEPVVFNKAGSRSRRASFDVQLGTDNKHSGPTNSRHYKNSGTNGAGDVWAATYDEWGWFLAALFEAEPDAIAGPYKGRDDFNRQTKDAYVNRQVCDKEHSHIPHGDCPGYSPEPGVGRTPAQDQQALRRRNATRGATKGI